MITSQGDSNNAMPYSLPVEVYPSTTEKHNCSYLSLGDPQPVNCYLKTTTIQLAPPGSAHLTGLC